MESIVSLSLDGILSISTSMEKMKEDIMKTKGLVKVDAETMEFLLVDKTICNTCVFNLLEEEAGSLHKGYFYPSLLGTRSKISQSSLN